MLSFPSQNRDREFSSGPGVKVDPGDGKPKYS